MGDFDMDALRSRLEQLMDQRQIKRKPLAKAAGLGETAIRDIFNPDRQDVRVGTLVRLADYFELTVDDLLAQPEQSLAGRIGAGGEVVFEAEEDPDAPSVPRPPGSHGTMMALQVVGASMLPKYEEGDVVYVRKDFDGIPKDAIGDYCAVRTADGGTYLKLLTKGSIPGRYTLRSLNAPDMEDQEIAWAAPVRWVKHRSTTQ